MATTGTLYCSDRDCSNHHGCLITNITVWLLGIAILFILLYPVVHAIAEHIGNVSVLNVDQAEITKPTKTSLDVKMDASVSLGGIFSATIKLNEPLQVAWVNASGDQVTLGSFSLDPLKVKSKRAYINQTVPFTIADDAAFSAITSAMITQPNFTWHLRSDKLNVRAIAFPTAHGLHFKKDVTLNGMNKFDGPVSIVDFKLPRDDAAGGIVFSATTGSTTRGLYLGTGSGANAVIKLGSSAVTLDGTLVPQRGTDALAKASELFRNYLNGEQADVVVAGKSSIQADGRAVSWPSAGLGSIDMPTIDVVGDMGADFDVDATFKVASPSQVGVELTSIGFQNFFQDVNIGPASATDTLSLSPLSTIPLALNGRLIPQKEQSGLDAVWAMFNAFIHGNDRNIVVQGDNAGPTHVTWLNEGIKALKVEAVLPNRDVAADHQSTAFNPSMGSDDTTAAFTLPFDFPIDIVALDQNITVGMGGTDFAELVIPKGPSTTEVEQRIIHLNFSRVPFGVRDGGHGTFEQFLSDTATSESETMTLKGAANTDAQTAVGLLSLTDIEFDVETTIAGLQGLNGAGDISFGLQFQGDTIGAADLSNLVIVPGNETYAIDVHYQPEGGAVASGQKMLENYLQGVESDTTIQGSTDSTPIESLELAMSHIRLTPVKIPALHQNLITSASLVFPTDIAKTGSASTTFVNAVATFGNLSLGSIDHVDRSSSPIHADGHSNITSPTLPFKFNLDPIMIIELFFTGAKNNGVDLGPSCLTISNLKLPSDDPAGGIHIDTDSLIPSPAQLGFNLGTVMFESSFKGTTVGPLTGNNLFLAPETTTSLHLSGRITPKSSDDLDVMGELFTNYLHAENQTLSVQGESIIQSIEMSDLELVMTEQSLAFAPDASSKHILTQYKNPFGFSLQAVKRGEDITLAAQGTNVAQLKLPQVDAVGGVSTGNVADLVLSFKHQTLQSVNNGAFTVFFAAVTDTSGIEFDLKGSADVVARTTIGDMPISAIPFDVTTSLKGINSFKKEASLSNVSITGSGHDDHGAYIKSPLTTTLQNPWNISLQTVDVALPVYYKDVMLGRAVIDPLNLVRGENTVPAELHYQPNDANDTTAQAFLTEFLQTADDIALTIKGDGDSSPFASLVPALEGLNVPPIITINFDLDGVLTTCRLRIANPLDTDMEITFTQVDSGVDGETYAHFDQAFDSFVIPAHSGTVKNVLLVKGALASLGIIPLGKLDVFSTATVKVGEYTIPWLHLTTLNVPTTYSLSLCISAMKQAAASISARKAGITVSSSGASSVDSATLSGSSGDASLTARSDKPCATAQSSEAESDAPSRDAPMSPTSATRDEASQA
ncbi:hypothetical protein L226DRAFT_588694 [Lentinus tigrinus ALCF2SS1-7]|uniref:Uncharacterized protein n=1 Tax=Lentinus tigrinus ALCF2SS1-6 TaxID=1328759 RepID=A0A5C2S214_9APHY|nr:hypothetical protein L227DRAFT_565475 [Lentinus tigrinus ALCF2SS1-6]RPD72146.1 hypothetical protein L226DRAFT_588694 [Lentinus tigrinus ALCF2SS1-7]